MSRIGADRLVTFSDAVVAIAMTLLGLPLVDLVPEAAAEGSAPVDIVLDNLVPIGSFVLSFLVIFRIWWVHHQLFTGVEVLSPFVMKANVVWLLSLLAVPFPAELVATYGDDAFVLAFYIGVLLVSSVSLAAMAVGLDRIGQPPEPAGPLLPGILGNALCLAAAFLVVLVLPQAGYWPLVLLLVDRPALAVVRRAQGWTSRWR
jgi:uncharacterized membrane protein